VLKGDFWRVAIRDDDQVDRLMASLEFLGYALKYREEACRRWIAVVHRLAVANMTCKVPDVFRLAGIVAARIGVMTAEVVELLQKNALSRKLAKVVAVLRCVSILLKKQAELPVDFLCEVGAIASSVITRQHRAFETGARDMELIAKCDGEVSTDVYKFLARFAHFRTAEFPCEELFRQIVAVRNVLSSREVALSLSVFISYISAAPEPGPFLGDLLEFSLGLLGSGWPEPIETVRVIAQVSPGLLSAHIPQLLEFCASVLSQSPNLAVVSLLWTLIIQGIPIPFDQFAQSMVNIPIAGDRAELKNCLAAACRFALASPEALGDSNMQQLIETLRRVLRTPRIKLPDELNEVMMQIVGADQGV